MSNPEVFVPIEVLAEHFSVSVTTIRLWIRKGHIPRSAFIKAGNTYRFKLSDVTSALLSNGSAVSGNSAKPKNAQEVAEIRVAKHVQEKDSKQNRVDVGSSTAVVESVDIEELFDEDM